MWGLHVLYEQQRNAASGRLVEIANAISNAVERDLARMETTLKTLALSPTLDRGDLTRFHDYAKAAAASDERTVVLVDPAGQQRINTRLALGSPVPLSPQFSDLATKGKPGETVVSNLYKGAPGDKPSYTVRVPVERERKVVGYIAMNSYASTLQESIADPKLPARWNIAVIDRTGTILARRLQPQEFVGTQVSEQLKNEIAAQREGFFEGTRLDGVPVLTAFTPIAATGWTLSMSMPKAEIDAQIVSALNVTVLITAVLLVLAMLAALYVGHTISRPIRHLVHLAAAVGRGEAIRAPKGGLTETRLVATELQQASERIHASNEIMERRVSEAVSESRRAHDALLQNQKLEALGKLTGGIAHDFNNLLQTISAAVEVALRLATMDTVKTAMGSAKRAVERATKLTRQLTTFGRGSVSAPATLDLRAHIGEFRDLIEGALRGDIGLKFDMSGSLWPVYVDPVQLELAVLNAALNARDAMPDGGELEIRATNETLARNAVDDLPPGDYVRVAIRDNGAGISAQDLPRVFEPFYSTKAVGKGSGLGLAQIYGFAKQSAGTATIASELGKGTTVSIFLPRSQHRQLSEASRSPEPRDAGAHYKVLFVEDDELVSAVLAPGLRASGFDVITAVDASSALEALRTNRVDVVLSDIVMPGKGDGFYLAQEISKVYPNLPIVLATGYSDALTAASPFRILLKPYSLDEARAALENAIGRARRRQAK
jgi:signal transduction histidine kinase/CheY-like chemotaxis protein